MVKFLFIFIFLSGLRSFAYFDDSNLPAVGSTLPNVGDMASGDQSHFYGGLMSGFGNAEKLSASLKNGKSSVKYAVTVIEGSQFEADAPAPSNLLIIGNGQPGNYPALFQLSDMIISKAQMISVDQLQITGTSANYLQDANTLIEITRTLVIKISYDPSNEALAATYDKVVETTSASKPKKLN